MRGGEEGYGMKTMILYMFKRVRMHMYSVCSIYVLASVLMKKMWMVWGKGAVSTRVHYGYCVGVGCQTVSASTRKGRGRCVHACVDMHIGTCV